MFSLEQIKKEFYKFFQNDYLQAELQRLKNELMDLEAYKKIQEPTLKHMAQLEKQYKALSKKISVKQKELDKEFNSAVTMLKKRKIEAEGHIKELQKLALDQKNSIEKIVHKQIRSLVSGDKKSGSKKKKKKAKTSEKKLKKKSKKKTS